MLYNQKYNAYIHFSKDLQKSSIKDYTFQSDFRPASPMRRRNPENLFPWFEANVSQNFEKWTIQAYKHTEPPEANDYYLYGGDVVRIKHAESGGFLSIEETENQQNTAYVRKHLDPESDDFRTYHSMFELEKIQEKMVESGSPLMWEEDKDSGN